MVGTVSSAVSYASINRRVDIDTLIAEAFAVGRTGSTMSRLLQMVGTVSNGTSLEPTILFDENALTLRVNQIAASSRVAPSNPRPLRSKTGWTIAAPKAGRSFDASAALPGLIAQLYDPNAPSSVSVALAGTDVQPTITPDKAQTALAKALAMDQPIVLANAGDTWTIAEPVVHNWISFKYVDGAFQPIFNDALIQKALTAMAEQINRPPLSASWNFGPKGVVVVPAKNGRTMDVAKTSRRIQLFLQGRADGTIAPDKKLGPTVTSTEPELSTADAEKQASKFKLLSTWTTYFQPAGHNGFGANIWVPAGYLDNQVVQPGETFSFWDRVGEVSLARGYKMGGAIVGGHTQEGVALAGGICSTSTTLFNAALRAGLKMGERSNHYYYITRYPVGLDATVSKSSGGGQQDMTFTNDTPYPILIKSFKTGGSVTFSLYGIPTGRTVTFSKPIITNYVRATSEVVHVSTLPAGRLVRIEYPDDGFNASVTAFVRDAKGKLISNRTYVSHYGMVKGVQYLGDPNGKPLTVPSYAPGAQGG
jgi:vancomycin resistance protein YoaR